MNEKRNRESMSDSRLLSAHVPWFVRSLVPCLYILACVTFFDVLCFTRRLSMA